MTGSVRAGFDNLGAITLSTALTSAEAVFLDDAGDGWISGTNSVFTGYESGHDQAGDAMYAQHGGWLAFRPADGSFGPAQPLPGGSQVGSTSVAGNAAGDALVTWTTPNSLYVAWSTPAGGLQQITQFRAPGPFEILRAGVDRRGDGIVILAEESSPPYARRVVAIRGIPGRPFRSPVTILTPAHDRRRHLTEYFESTTVAINEGSVYLATTAAWERANGGESNRPSRSLLVRIPTAGSTRGTTLSAPSRSVGTGIAADSYGHVLLINEAYELEAIDIQGRSRELKSLPQAVPEAVSITSNAHGQVAIGLPRPHDAYGVTMTLIGSHRHLVRFSTRAVAPWVAATIDAHGNGTLFWSDEDPTGEGQTLYAHPLAPGGAPIQAANATSLTQ